jgi:heme exporter protein D
MNEPGTTQNNDALFFDCNHVVFSNSAHRTLSAFVVDAWAESLLNVCTQLIQTLKQRESFVQSALQVQSRSLQQASLQGGFADQQLQQSLNELERKYRTSESQRIVMGRIHYTIMTMESTLVSK